MDVDMDIVDMNMVHMDDMDMVDVDMVDVDMVNMDMVDMDMDDNPFLLCLIYLPPIPFLPLLSLISPIPVSHWSQLEIRVWMNGYDTSIFIQKLYSIGISIILP